MFFLDTNTCICFLNGKYESIKIKILSTPPDQIKIPSVIKAELLLGAYKSKRRKSNLERLEMFLAPFEILPLDEQVTYQYAEIRFQTERAGKVVGPNDLFIASIVKYHEGILVTRDITDFSAIAGLKIENWAEQKTI